MLNLLVHLSRYLLAAAAYNFEVSRALAPLCSANLSPVAGSSSCLFFKRLQTKLTLLRAISFAYFRDTLPFPSQPSMSIHKSARSLSEITCNSQSSPLPCPSASSSTVLIDGKPFLRTHKKPMSSVVEGLTHSRGSIALISVMCAGFAFQGCE